MSLDAVTESSSTSTTPAIPTTTLQVVPKSAYDAVCLERDGLRHQNEQLWRLVQKQREAITRLREAYAPQASSSPSTTEEAHPPATQRQQIRSSTHPGAADTDRGHASAIPVRAVSAAASLGTNGAMHASVLERPISPTSTNSQSNRTNTPTANSRSSSTPSPATTTTTATTNTTNTTSINCPQTQETVLQRQWEASLSSARKTTTKIAAQKPQAPSEPEALIAGAEGDPNETVKTADQGSVVSAAPPKTAENPFSDRFLAPPAVGLPTTALAPPLASAPGALNHPNPLQGSSSVLQIAPHNPGDYLLPYNIPNLQYAEIALTNDPSSLQIKVVSLQLRVPPKSKEPVTHFILHISAGDSMTWLVEKTYDQVLDLHKQLEEANREFHLDPPPGRPMATSIAPANSLRRKYYLEVYLSQMEQVLKTVTSPVLQFLRQGVLCPPPHRDVGDPKLPPDVVRKEGYLVKRGKGRGQWKARYWTLVGGLFQYMESKEGYHLGAIDLRVAQVTTLDADVGGLHVIEESDDVALLHESEFRHAFVLVPDIRRPSQQHILCAQDGFDRDEWVKALQTVICLLKRANANSDPTPPSLSTATSTAAPATSGASLPPSPSRALHSNFDSCDSIAIHDFPQPQSGQKGTMDSSQSSMDSSNAYGSGSRSPTTQNLNAAGHSARQPSPLHVASSAPNFTPSQTQATEQIQQQQPQQQSSVKPTPTMAHGEPRQNRSDSQSSVASQTGFKKTMSTSAVSTSSRSEQLRTSTKKSDTRKNESSSSLNASTTTIKHSKGWFGSSSSNHSKHSDTDDKGSAPLSPSTSSSNHRMTAFFFKKKTSNASSQLASSKSLFGRDKANSSSSNRDSSVSPTPPTPPKTVFGVPLEKSCQVAKMSEQVPLPAVVYRCIEYLDQKGAEDEEGIYRVSGSTATIRALRDKFNKDGDYDILGSGKHYDVHAVSGLLKLFLRELPTSVLTRDLQRDFLKIMDLRDKSSRLKELARLISVLPLVNYTLLRALIAHLIRIVKKASTNKMTVRNVGIVFSPTLGMPAGVFTLLVMEFDAAFGGSGGESEAAQGQYVDAPSIVETDGVETSVSRHQRALSTPDNAIARPGHLSAAQLGGNDFASALPALTPKHMTSHEQAELRFRKSLNYSDRAPDTTKPLDFQGPSPAPCSGARERQAHLSPGREGSAMKEEALVGKPLGARGTSLPPPESSALCHDHSHHGTSPAYTTSGPSLQLSREGTPRTPSKLHKVSAGPKGAPPRSVSLGMAPSGLRSPSTEGFMREELSGSATSATQEGTADYADPFSDHHAIPADAAAAEALGGME